MALQRPLCLRFVALKNQGNCRSKHTDAYVSGSQQCFITHNDVETAQIPNDRIGSVICAVSMSHETT